MTFKFICNVDSFHNVAFKYVIYKKENKDAAPQLKNLEDIHFLKKKLKTFENNETPVVIATRRHISLSWYFSIIC